MDSVMEEPRTVPGLLSDNIDSAASIVNDIDTVEPLLEGNVYVSGKEKSVRLTSKGLQVIGLEDSQKLGKTQKCDELSVPWRDIIYAGADLKSVDKDRQSIFSLHYAHHCSNRKLQLKTLKMAVCKGESEKWIWTIQKWCLQVEGRPKKLFVIINPIGGSGRARQTFQKSVAPLFKLAQIDTTVVVTERAKHALEIAERQDFSGYDGIVVVGGDGLYQEVLQGYVVQTQKKAGVDINDCDIQLEKPNMPFGIIPAGTGNGVSGMVNSILDVVTAALNIIRGEQHRAIAFTVHSRAKFVSVGALLLGYGVFSDIIKRTDELRWMKRARYAYCMTAVFWQKKRRFNCELEYLCDDVSSTLDQDGKTADIQERSEKGWVRHNSDGRSYCGISMFAAECVDAGDKNIIDHFGENLVLMVDTGCSTFGMYKQLFKFYSGRKLNSTPANLDMIECVKRFRIKIIPADAKAESNQQGARAREQELEKIVNVDGEAIYLEHPELEIRMLPSFVLSYGCLPGPVQSSKK